MQRVQVDQRARSSPAQAVLRMFDTLVEHVSVPVLAATAEAGLSAQDELDGRIQEL